MILILFNVTGFIVYRLQYEILALWGFCLFFLLCDWKMWWCKMQVAGSSGEGSVSCDPQPFLLVGHMVDLSIYRIGCGQSSDLCHVCHCLIILFSISRSNRDIFFFICGWGLSSQPLPSQMSPSYQSWCLCDLQYICDYCITSKGLDLMFVSVFMSRILAEPHKDDAHVISTLLYTRDGVPSAGSMKQKRTP